MFLRMHPIKAIIGLFLCGSLLVIHSCKDCNCAADSSNNGVDTGTSTENNSDADSDSDADTDTDSDSDGDTDADADGDTDADADGDTDTDADGDTDTDADGDTDTDADGDTDADVDGDTDADSDSDGDTGPDTGADSGEDTLSDTFEDSGSDTGIDSNNAVSGVSISGRQLLINGEPFVMKGVCWNPVPKGQTHPEGLDYAGLGVIDIPLMQAAGINAVRTYEPVTDHAVLDALFDAGIYILNTVYPWGGADASSATAHVNAVKDHPAVLMWVIGNEWNYNGLYVDLSHEASLARINEVAEIILASDTTHPIATIYGELPSVETVNAMPNIDVWGINAYRGISFGNLFSDWEALAIPEKPMFMAEFGADAFNANLPGYDPESQAEATEALVGEIMDNNASTGGVALGGTLFEWADEWWKADNPAVQDNGGIAPGGGPYPDQTFNEEWWGIVDIDRNPRAAYDALKEIYLAN